MTPPSRTARRLRVLLVEDSEQDAELLVEELRRAGSDVLPTRVDTRQDLSAALAGGDWDLVLCDYVLPGFDAIEALATVRASGRDLPTIVVSGTMSEEAAVSAMRAGAHDFVLKGNLVRLAPAVDRELQEADRRRDQQRTQEQLIVSERLASVGLLAAGVAHEINNPLAAVLANLQLAEESSRELQARGAAVGPLAEALADAIEGAERVRQIVRDVKVFSRRQEDPHEPIDVHRVLDSAVRMAWNDIRHRARLVKAYGSVRAVLASEARLGQVFLNLLVNAAQAIEEGKAQQNEIRLTTGLDGDQVVVEIADTGPGVPPAVRERLFTPFVTTKPPEQGTGLGLSIAQRIVRGLGGTLEIRDREGGGTLARVVLPGTDQRPIQRDSSSGLAAFGAGRRGRILVVDDEAMITNVIRRALGRHHDVQVAFEGRQALARIEAGERFDLILCDLLMPQMTGMELYEELERAAPDQAARVVFLSGGAFTERSASFLAGFSGRVLEKPFDRAALFALVAEWLR